MTRMMRARVHRTVTGKRRTIVSAARNAILRGDSVCVSEFHDLFDQSTRDDVRIVHSADDEPFPDFGIREAL
jgi:hypothetical protein